MGRKILAVIVALIVAVAIMMIVEMLNSLQLAPPTAEILKDPAKLAEYMANGPARAYIVVLIGYVLASFAGGFIVTKNKPSSDHGNCSADHSRGFIRAGNDREYIYADGPTDMVHRRGTSYLHPGITTRPSLREIKLATNSLIGSFLFVHSWLILTASCLHSKSA